jgi:hypothetical protein
MENLTGHSADNTPDSSLHSADNTPDSMPDDRQKKDIFSKISILELQKKYNIGRDSLYGRMRYLRITTYKVKGKAYLDAGQVAHMDALHDHIKANGKMEGYPIPEPTEPVEEQAPHPTATQNEQAPHPTVAITVSEPGQLTTEQEVIKDARQHDNSETEAIASLIRNAQNKATGLLIAENMLAQQFIQNPEQLPEELRTKIKESGEMPTIDPFAYANSLINLANVPGVA